MSTTIDLWTIACPACHNAETILCKDDNGGLYICCNTCQGYGPLWLKGGTRLTATNVGIESATNKVRSGPLPGPSDN